MFGALLHGTLQLHSMYHTFADHGLVRDGHWSTGLESEEPQAPTVWTVFSVSNARSLLTTGLLAIRTVFLKDFLINVIWTFLCVCDNFLAI